MDDYKCFDTVPQGFDEVPQGWQRVFADLKTLVVGFGEDYEDFTPRTISGLRAVLGWASNVKVLHCSTHWSLYWDDIAADAKWPTLKHLSLESCKVTESFLETFLEHHDDVNRMDIMATIHRTKDAKDPIGIKEAAKMFCSSTYNGIDGEISLDEFENWRGILKISHKEVKLIPKEGKEEVYEKEWQ